MGIRDMTTDTPQNEPFGMLYQSVIKDKRLTDTAVRVLAFIKSFPPAWRVNYRFISRELGISQSTVTRSINNLDRAGYLTYDLKEKKVGKERRNIRMRHRPAHWDLDHEATAPLSPTRSRTASEPSSLRSDLQRRSEMPDHPVKVDVGGSSKLTSYKEIKKSNFEDLNQRCDSEALWKAFNCPPDGYLQISPDDLTKDESVHVARLCGDLEEVEAGLRLRNGQHTADGVDYRYYADFVVAALKSRSKNILPPLFAVCKVDGGFIAYINPNYAQSKLSAKSEQEI